MILLRCKMKIVESRPCVCNRVSTGLYYTPTDCMDCWSYYFDPYWSERWGRPKEKKPPHLLLEDKDPEFIKKFQEAFSRFPKSSIPEQEKQLRVSLPCVSLGTIISRANCNCPLKFVHNCDKHGKCVRGPQQDPSIRSCQDCPDYEEDTPFA